ncbi:HD-GYP domain-containing protein (c-di-GMP phosphodiesterase class II) [Fonticella tunisiensis]|uniref:HD-GYP domain-containing protein (C-di-GMP phosphodiesterase class II) n=1 Tax=Fonticella tunisiensis TaxID=1096341 RepID=A0A4R7KB24_9CLOT|nr:HD-GYP domain-containing protein (c-di-GMP phosphodiesterase class II) [Fonticella tunisiensis]
MNKVNPGDVLAQSLLGVDGTILLREGVTLTERYIKKLMELEIEYIYIKDDRLDDIKSLDPEFLKIKIAATKSLSKVFSRLQYNDKSSIKDVMATIADIVEYLIDNKEINSTYLLELKTFDNYTYVHSLNTSVLALFFGVQLSYSKSMLIDLGAGALLHDIGKTKVPIEILNKRGKLTKNEYDIMKTHPERGYEIVKNVDYIGERGKLIVLEHHERVDGRGYPFGIKGDEISKFGKIACISDVYDAIVSDRVYRNGLAANEAYEFILGGAGSFFDFELVNIFKQNFSIYPLGACVRLSNGLEGFVVGHNKGFPDRPVVRIIYDEGNNSITPVEINLIQKLDVCIEKIII